MITHIQRAKPSQVRQLVNIERLCFSDDLAFGERQFHHSISKGNVWVCLQQKIVVADLVLIRYKTAKGLLGRIYSVVVHPNHQGNGYGRKLMEHVITTLRIEGAYAVISEIAETNNVSIRLHQKMGFTTVRFMWDYYGPKQHGLKLLLRL